MFCVHQKKSILIMVLFSSLTSQLFSQSKGGRWQFENNGLDRADWDGSSNNGILQGQASYDNLTPLQEGSEYLWLDPTDQYDYIKINDSDDLDFDDENIAISAWIYPVKNGLQWIIHKGDFFSSPKTTNYSLRLSKNDNIEFLIRDSQGAKKVASSFTLLTDQWTFLAIFYDYGDGKVYMWNDLTESPVDTLDFNKAYFSNNDPLTIGSRFSSDLSAPSDNDYEGRIDDVRISGRLEDIFSTTGIDYNPEEILSFPSEFTLSQNYPNPFNPITTIEFSVPKDQHVLLTVYDIQGRTIKTLLDAPLQAGWHQITLDASDFGSGVYFYKITSPAYNAIRKMLLVK
ncbi:T9SS type A sorting domain-containing protein [candidate division KSB1 bacterium]|nr:T9SS type A sorting domain-containing protein [candidate division KSB1 bacterium]